MGLDMYLTKKTYVKNWDHISEDQRYQVTVCQNGNAVNHIKPERITYITEELGCWRKANAIHQWFVANVQSDNDDCATYYVDPSQLIELLNLVKQVQADHSLAESLLPTRPGFFFGGTEYDEWYFEDLKLTNAILESALSEDRGDLEYHSSW